MLGSTSTLCPVMHLSSAISGITALYLTCPSVFLIMPTLTIQSFLARLCSTGDIHTSLLRLTCCKPPKFFVIEPLHHQCNWKHLPWYGLCSVAWGAAVAAAPSWDYPDLFPSQGTRWTSHSWHLEQTATINLSSAKCVCFERD